MTTTTVNDRATQAYQWYRALCWIGGISTVLAFVYVGTVFATGDAYGSSGFNAAAAFGAAIATALAYLPFVAILDVLRRTA